jgi:cell division protein FtsW
MQQRKGVDKIFLAITMTLIIIGFMIFVSASLGIWARSGVKFENMLLSQIGFGLTLGSIMMFALSRLKIQHIRKNAFWFLVASAILSLLVFVPGIGMEHNGAKRWIDVGITTFQPGEILKLAVVIYLAAWLTLYKRKIHTALFGMYPLVAILGVACAIFIAQRDTGSFLIVACAGTAMFIAAGARWRDIALLCLLGLILLGGLALWRPYVLDRFTTLWNHDDFQGSGYQVRQSLIAIGSGGVAGKGFGQSIQKFNYLPEAQGDSVFAVAAEEFGFLGSALLILLYVLFALRGLWISAHAGDVFMGLLAVGLVILITAQSFINIASMLAIAPLTGVPLVFVSQGGTALLMAMMEVGLLLNISRNRTTR